MRRLRKRRPDIRECSKSQNMRRFRPEGLAARRGHCGVSMEWLSPMRSTQRQAPLDGNPSRAASFLALGCVAALGQGPTGIGASPKPCKKPKMPAKTPILTCWTLYSRTARNEIPYRWTNRRRPSRIGFPAPVRLPLRGLVPQRTDGRRWPHTPFLPIAGIR